MNQIPEDLLNRSRAARIAAEGRASASRPAPDLTINDLLSLRDKVGSAQEVIESAARALGFNHEEFGMLCRILIREANEKIGALT